MDYSIAFIFIGLTYGVIIIILIFGKPIPPNGVLTESKTLYRARKSAPPLTEGKMRGGNGAIAQGGTQQDLRPIKPPPPPVPPPLKKES